MKRSELKKMLRQDIENAAPSDFEGLMAKCAPAEPVAVREAALATAGVDGRARRGLDKRYLIALTALLLAIALTLPLLLWLGNGESDPLAPLFEKGSILIDVNPSLELCYDENGTVTEAVALNRDAEVLLYGLSLAGKSYEDAVSTVFERCVQLGFFAADRTDNAVLTSAVNANGHADEAMTRAVTEQFSKAFAAGKLPGVVITGAESPALAAGAAQYGITPQKYALILSCEALGDDTVEESEYATVSVRELHARINQKENANAQSELNRLEKAFEDELEILAETVEELLERLAERIEDLQEHGPALPPAANPDAAPNRDKDFYEQVLERLEDAAEEIENATTAAQAVQAVSGILAELTLLSENETAPALTAAIDLTAKKIAALLETYTSLDARSDALSASVEDIYNERRAKFEQESDDDGDDLDPEDWQEKNADEIATAWHENRKNWENDRNKD